MRQKENDQGVRVLEIGVVFLCLLNDGYGR